MIVSLTSFPARIPHIAPCVASLVSQIESGDRLVLWLGSEQFPHGLEDVPPQIRTILLIRRMVRSRRVLGYKNTIRPCRSNNRKNFDCTFGPCENDYQDWWCGLHSGIVNLFAPVADCRGLVFEEKIQQEDTRRHPVSLSYVLCVAHNKQICHRHWKTCRDFSIGDGKSETMTTKLAHDKTSIP